MGWKGTLRSLEAAQRRSEREARRRQRELERQQKQAERMQELERAAYEVEVFDNYSEVLTSIHKECGESWNWEEINTSGPPVEPSRDEFTTFESKARLALANYNPSMVDKIARRVESKQAMLAAAIEKGKREDEADYQRAKLDYDEELIVNDLSGPILAGDLRAYEEIIRRVDPFSEISHLGSSVKTWTTSSSVIESVVLVNDEEVIPKESKSLLKSGKLSVKNMTKGNFYALYQDYVCGCVLRIARELFALLPVELAVVTAKSKLLNTATGHLEEQPILSAAIPKATLKGLNFDSLDPSDSMQNFVHNMKFYKTKGFAAVNAVDLGQLQTKAT